MKNLCYLSRLHGKRSLLLSALLLSAAWLHGAATARAADVSFYNGATSSGVAFCVDGSGTSTGEIITATHKSISRVDFSEHFYDSIGSPLANAGVVGICEVASLTSMSCLDTASTSLFTIPAAGSGTNYLMSVAISPPHETTIGHFYKINITNTYGSGAPIVQTNTYTAAPLSDANFYYYGGLVDTQDMVGQIYYESTLDATPLALSLQFFDSNTGTLELTGTCDTVGTGAGQIFVYYSSLGDPYGQHSECFGDTWAVNYNNPLLHGTSTVTIRDVFHSTTITATQDFGSVSTEPWTGSVGYIGTGEASSTAHALACSASEYASANWWDQFKCSVFQTGLNVSYGFSDWGKATALGAGRSASYIFPFNFVTGVKNSWDLSATSTLSTDLDVFALGTSTTNIGMPVPPALAGGSTTTKLVLWGPSILQPNSDVAKIITAIRLVTTLVMWALFAYWLYLTGHEMYSEWIS